MWSKKIALISVISTTALLTSVGIASAMPNFSLGQLSHKSGIAFNKMNQKPGGACVGSPVSSIMKVVAQDLSISTQTLMTELGTGKSINDLATAKGVETTKLAQDVQAALTDNIKQAVQAGKITQDQATTMESKLSDQVQKILSQTRKAKAKGNREVGFARPMSSIMNVVAQDLGISTQTLRSELSSGKSINDLATAKDVEKSKLAQDVHAALTENIKQAVQAGKMTQEQATTMESKLSDRVQKILSQTRQTHTNTNRSSLNSTTTNL